MAKATFLSDLKLIVDSVLRRWDSSIMEGLLTSWTSERRERELFSRTENLGNFSEHTSIRTNVDRLDLARSGLLQMPDPAGREPRIEKEFLHCNKVHDSKASQRPCQSRDLCPVGELNR
jgi:hypothetical protein